MNRIATLSLIAIFASLASGCDNRSGVSKEIAKQERADAEAKSARSAANAAFLSENAAKPGVKTTPSGLQIEVIRPALEAAAGRHPGPSDIVTVNYEGALPDGRVFDSSYERGQPASFPLNAVIPAWTEAVQLMSPGEEIRLVTPPALGYGEAGAPPDIPGNSVLVFKIELLKIHAGNE